MQARVLVRIRPILFSILAVAASHNLFFVLLPVRLREVGVDPSLIGVAMSFFAAGGILAGLFGSRAVLRVGHVRAFSSMAATLAIVAIVHSYATNVWITAGLRLVAGFCFVTSFITLESWLNVLSDKSNRGRVFSIYQICFALGFGLAPLFLSVLGDYDPRFFALISALLCVALITMSMSLLPAPEVTARARPMSLRRLWSYSPSGVIACFCGGLISTASVSLVSLYAYDKGLLGIWLAVVLGSYQLGGLITQFPTGVLADRFDKRSVAVGLMLMGVLSNGLIIFDSLHALPTGVLVGLFILSGGSGAALFPLAVTQVFDHIELKEALSATSTLQVVMGVGGVIGPVVAGYFMGVFDTIALYYYLLAVHALVMAFLLVRKVLVRSERLQPKMPYQINTQPTSLGSSGLDPRIDYSLAEIDDPGLKLLLIALGQQPKDVSLLIQTALESDTLKPADVAMHMVLALPKHAEELMQSVVTLYPEQRLEIAHSLHDLFVLRKQRINARIAAGLVYGATPQEVEEVRALIADVLREVGADEDKRAVGEAG